MSAVQQITVAFSSAAGGGSPTFRSVGSLTSGPSPLAPPLPAGLTAGDFMLMVFSGANGLTTVPPTGWTSLVTTTNNLQLFYKVAGGAETTPSLPCGAGATHDCFILAYSGVNATPVDITGTEANGSGSTTTTNSVTTVTANTTVISVFQANSGTLSTPAGTTSRYNATGVNSTITVVDEAKAGAGATTTRQSSVGSSLSWRCYAFAIKP